jgi:hypothetical protein
MAVKEKLALHASCSTWDMGGRIQVSSGTQFEHEERCGKTLNVGKKMVAMFDNFLG